MDPSSSLRDIRGLDPISWWPPAIGWWLTTLAVLAVVGILVWLVRQRVMYPLGDWQKDARRQLLALRHRLKSEPPKQVAAELSELLRRVAIARCGRAASAALSGDDWLAWLSKNDKLGFDWQHHGQLLLSLPYAPPDAEGDSRAIGHLIDAALLWVSHEERCDV